ncbi:MAG: TonB-dependent receptor [Bryobacteraceae bacterium]|nr:TonB-dependent receptor [Bryobacteraceae bacterium]
MIAISRAAWMGTLFTILACAQMDVGSIVGGVRDATGAAVAGAKVTVTNEGTNVSLVTTTGNNGEYVVPALKVGTYTVVVEKDGFQRFRQTGIVLNIQDRRQVDADLVVGSVTQEVQVTGDVPLLQTQGAQLGQVVEAKRIQDLPLNGREYDSLALLSPGVTITTPRQRLRGQGVFSVNGNTALQNNFLLDGVDNNSFSTNLQEGSAQVVIPSVDALAEFRVQTRTYDAEFGRNAGSVVNATTKSGTNQVHGNLFHFLRNRNLDANDWFANRAGLQRPKFQQNQFGFTLGGPVVFPKLYDGRNKTFWFVNYEGARRRRGTTTLSTVPTPLMRQLDFRELRSAPNTPLVLQNPAAPGMEQFANCINANRLSSSCVDRVAARLLPLFPLPNTNRGQEGVTGGFAGLNYVSAPVERTDANQGGARVDHTFSEKDSIFVRFAIMDTVRVRPGAFADFNPIADGSFNAVGGQNLNRGTSGAISWTHVFNPRIVNEFRAGYNRVASNSQQLTFGQNVNDQFGLVGFPVSPNFTGGLPSLAIAGFGGLGAPEFLPQNQYSHVWSWRDALTWIKGSHTFKFGGEIRRDSQQFLDVCCNRGSFNFNGQYTRSGLVDFLLGAPQRVALTSETIPHQYQDGFSWFAQDTWRVTKKLTLNYGLRYEYVSPEIERDNRYTNFDYSARNGQGALVTARPDADGVYERALVRPDRNNFAPRIGIAYQISSKLVFRAGGGYFFQGYDRHGSEAQLGLNPPFLTDVQQTYVQNQAPLIYLQNGFPRGFMNPVPIDDLDRVAGLFLRTTAQNRRVPYIGQVSAGFQYSITKDMAIEVDYTGNSAHKLWRLMNANQLRLVTPGQPGILPYPDFRVNRAVPAAPGASPTTIQLLDSVGNSNYNGLQIKLEKRFSAGLSFLVSYAWSKSLADAQEMLSTSGDERGFGRSVAPQDRWNLKAERGFYLNDTPRRLVTSWSYELPVGAGHRFGGGPVIGKILERWQVNGIATFADGQPLGIISVVDTSRTGGYKNNRPDCLRPDRLENRTVSQYLDPGAYAIPQAFFFGSCGPTPGVRVPGLHNWDLSFFKHIPVTEKAYFQFRAEMFNIFNRAAFQGPNPRLGEPSFGQIRATQGDPRQIQFALKFYY